MEENTMLTHRFVTQAQIFNVTNIAEFYALNGFMKSLGNDYERIIPLSDGHVLVLYRMEITEEDTE